MRDLNYQLKDLYRKNRDGSYATQAQRLSPLTLIANQLHELGFCQLEAQSLKPKHVEALVKHWMPIEARKVLNGHRNGDITSHYAAPELAELLEAANRVCEEKSGKTPALVVLKQTTSYRGLDNRLNLISDLARPERFELPPP